ncbi:MAG: formylglycine-generating enzyme family protein [Desulfobacteria bacterium]
MKYSHLALSAVFCTILFVFHPSPAFCNASNVIEPKMALIPGGFFVMGSEAGESDEMPEHRVTLKAFYLAEHEVTNREFAAFLMNIGKSADGGGRELINFQGAWKGERCRIKKDNGSFAVEAGYERYPVCYVTWFGAQEYCSWLSRKTGKRYRLPTEAEWEYAAGGGDMEYRYGWGDISPIRQKGGNIADKSAEKVFCDWTVWNDYDDGYVYAAPIESFRANRFGLHDMTGNVSEWCADWYGEYPVGIFTNPAGPRRGIDRVKRGGSWFSPPYDVRVTKRDHAVPAYCDFCLGFRVAMSAKKQP